MKKNKWEYRENFHSTGCGDYDGCHEVTDGHIFLCTNDDPEDVTENENALQQIARLMNESGCKFYSNNVLELNQHIEIQKQKYEIEDLQAKCERYEKERYETRLAMRMLLKVFRGVARSPEQVKYYEQADYIFNKYFHVDDALRDEALAGDGEPGFDYKSREFEKGKPATDEALKRMHDRWRITGERVECECGLWIVPADGCPDCKNQKEDKQ